MFIPLVIFSSLLVALLRGGRLTNLAHLPLRHFWVLFLPLVLQLIAFSPLGDVTVSGVSLARVLYGASLGLAAFALWLNRQLPGVVWIALGLFLNCVVILLNGGFMPISAQARAVAGLPPVVGREMNVVPLTQDTILPWLGDILPLPAFIPFATVFSIGDILIAIGGILFIQRSLVPSKQRSSPFTEGERISE
jgi:hypothetical protein